MGLFDRKTPLQKEWEILEKKEKKFLEARLTKQDSLINRTLEEKVPEKLQSTLDSAFAKAFQLIFDKGTGVIEKTYSKEKLQQEFEIRDYASEAKKDRKSLKAISKGAKGTGNRNLLLSGVSGIGMGVLGIGLPDIPLFTGMIFKNIYEISLNYGIPYDTEEEKQFILQVIKGAVSYGDELKNIDQALDEYMYTGAFSTEISVEDQIRETAGALSKELLYLKFLQGIPVVGAVGGMYDAIYMKRISAYASLKYQKRYLSMQRKKYIEVSKS